MKNSNIKLDFKKQMGARVKQARTMGGFATQKDLNEILVKKHGWSTGRLGNYESGGSAPGHDELLILSQETGTSACWIMFGTGPIRSDHRDLQAIRHQNLVHSLLSFQENKKEYTLFLKKAESNAEAIGKFIDNPFKKIGDRQARRFERALKRPKGWMDEQHIDIDPICNNFPEDLRELMLIYSELEEKDRVRLLEIARLL